MGFEIQARPGHSYDIAIPAPDGVDPGTRWVGGRMVQRGPTPVDSLTADAGPLDPMYRRRLIVKLDDLQDFSLDCFQRVVRAIGENGGKADMGINPGRCEPAVFAWVRTLDPARFEVWNHSWDHGAEGPKHRALPLEAQIENLDLVQRKVKEGLGVTPRAWGAPGIRWKDGWIGDQDDVTYLAVRSHPELVAIFDGGRAARRLGLQDDPDPLFDPISLVTFESPPEDWDRGDPSQRYLLDYVATKYPGEDPMRPPICGNAAELKWRIDHPSTDLAAVDAQGAAYAQFHPWYWKLDSDAAAIGEWVSYVNAKREWRFSNCYEAFKWHRDRGLLTLEKTGPDRYQLDARLARYEHRVETTLPSGSRAEERAYVIPLD